MRKKSGTKIGQTDANGVDICIGDRLRDTITGKEYTINSYGSAIGDSGAKLLFKPSQSVIINDEKTVATPDEEIPTAPEQDPEDDLPISPEDHPSNEHEKEEMPCNWLTDDELFEQLEQRGWKIVKAEKIEVRVYETAHAQD